jgi:transmembrane sensor
MKKNTTSRLNSQIYEEASEWFVDFRAGDLDVAGRRAFDLWTRQSPEHLAAYLEIAAIWNEGPNLDPNIKWTASTLTTQANVATDKVISIVNVRAENSDKRIPELCTATREVNKYAWLARSARTGPLRRTFIASIVPLLIVTILGLWFALRTPTYSTGFGEQRSIELADGSLIEMDSRSTIAVRYSADERDVDLLQGQALFHVAKDHSRPFVVTSGNAYVRAVGTQFDVDQKTTGTVVTVVEGRVAVLDSASQTTKDRVNKSLYTPSSLFISTGEQLIVSHLSTRKPIRTNVANATAWTQRQLAFDSASLSDVAEEFNRYNRRQLVIQDPALYNFHITGIFSSVDPGPFLQFLRERPGVRVVETASEIRVSRDIS